MSRFEPGDYVLVRGKVLKGDDGELGYCIELFSKTDQYGAWVRPDLVIEKAEMPLPPEPDQSAIVKDCDGDLWEGVGMGSWSRNDSRTIETMTWPQLFRTRGPVMVFEESINYAD